MMLCMWSRPTEAEFSRLGKAHAWRVEVEAQVLWWVFVARWWSLLAEAVAYHLRSSHCATTARVGVLSGRHRLHILLEFSEVFKCILEELLLILLLLVLGLEVLGLVACRVEAVVIVLIVSLVEEVNHPWSVAHTDVGDVVTAVVVAMHRGRHI